MKKMYCWALALPVVLAGCQPSGTDREVSVEEKIPVSFSIRMSEEVLPFPVTRGMPGFDMPEPVAVKSDTDPAGETKEVSELCDAIEYVVYDKDHPGDPLRHRHYTLADDDFGIVYDSLPAGEYTLAFLAHSSVCGGLENGVMRFDKLSDTFWETIPLEVRRGAQINEDVELHRIVGQIEFVAKDAVPAEVHSFHVSSRPRHDKLNILTGRAVTTEATYTVSHTFTSAERGKTGLRFAFLTFIPSSGQPPLHVTLTAKGASDEEVYHRREIPEVTPLANRVVRYTGFLFTPTASDDTFPIFIHDDGKWGEPDEHELQD